MHKDYIYIMDMKKIHFKYHPNIYEDDILVHKSGICQCCGKQINEYIEHVYSAEDVDCICLQCVSDGTVAQSVRSKQNISKYMDEGEQRESPKRIKELLYRIKGVL